MMLHLTGTVTFFIQTFFIQDKVYTGQSLYRTKFIRGQSLYGTKFIRGQSLYGTKFIRGQSLYGTKFIRRQSLYKLFSYCPYFHTVTKNVHTVYAGSYLLKVLYSRTGTTIIKQKTTQVSEIF